ncbi:unnamed protein product [Sphenostylis stenocarpa]|uniref:Enoyl reductase (ER) domain-containing protein n=1 Tax=Sphenostylis stenocarpa TaxID=92480 RepID=A0AA86VYT0_9FABA|nr:unnamed protein product [Sphenostylis stenocarpa]
MEEEVKSKGEEETWVVESKEWYLLSYAPNGVPTTDHLKLRTVRLSLQPESIPHAHLAIETLILSIDPYLRSRFTGNLDGLYFPQFQLDQVITIFGIGRVKLSNDSEYKDGDLVLSANFPVAEYCIMPSSEILEKIDAASGISLPDYLSSLGVPGFAAWLGIEVVADPKPGSNVFISAASGGVGMIAGQLAKIRGCRVIGSTGSDEKVSLLKALFPDGIDVYLDNVGGKILESVLNHVNKYARIPLCGMISQYNQQLVVQVWTERYGVRNLLNMVGKEVRMEGYLLNFNRFGEFAKEMGGHIKEGRVKSKVKINIGIETFLDSLNSLFTGSNVGKVVIQVKA